MDRFFSHLCQFLSTVSMSKPRAVRAVHIVHTVHVSVSQCLTQQLQGFWLSWILLDK